MEAKKECCCCKPKWTKTIGIVLYCMTATQYRSVYRYDVNTCNEITVSKVWQKLACWVCTLLIKYDLPLELNDNKKDRDRDMYAPARARETKGKFAAASKKKLVMIVPLECSTSGSGCDMCMARTFDKFFRIVYVCVYVYASIKNNNIVPKVIVYLNENCDFFCPTPPTIRISGGWKQKQKFRGWPQKLLQSIRVLKITKQ